MRQKILLCGREREMSLFSKLRPSAHVRFLDRQLEMGSGRPYCEACTFPAVHRAAGQQLRGPRSRWAAHGAWTHRCGIQLPRVPALAKPQLLLCELERSWVTATLRGL